MASWIGCLSRAPFHRLHRFELVRLHYVRFLWEYAGGFFLRHDEFFRLLSISVSERQKSLIVFKARQKLILLLTRSSHVIYSNKPSSIHGDSVDNTL